MEARYEARKAEFRDDTRRAWQIGNFVGAAFGGKLKSLDHYLKAPAQEPKEMLAALRAIQSSGAKMNIRQVERVATG